jgi:hypothetical protein
VSDAEPREDPGGARAAVNRYRDLAKYLIGVFAAVAGLLLAGTQLTSVGMLSWDRDKARVIAAAIGLIVALGAVVRVIALALRVLQPIEISASDVEGDPSLKAYLESRPTALGGAGTLARVREMANSSLLSDDERAQWAGVLDDALATAALKRARDAFDGAWHGMLVAGVLGAAGIVAFAWAANPPKNSSASPVVNSQPMLVSVHLTHDGMAALRPPLGTECDESMLRALVIGGSQDAPDIVTLPEHACRSIRLVLSSELGLVLSSTTAPSTP